MTTIAGVGPQLDRAAAGTDPRGWLVFAYLPDDLQSAEDSTAAADAERHQCGTYNTPAVWGTDDPAELVALQSRAQKALAKARLRYPSFPRPATQTERALLDHLGYTLPAELFATITFTSSGIRNRRFPQLETEQS